MGDSAFDDIQKAYTDLKGSVDKSAAEIRKQKDEIQRLRALLYDLKEGNKYIRDDKRLVLSAPEIVIGNVDCMGNLLGSELGGVVTLRGNDVQLFATNTSKRNGIVETKASTIMNLAVDPGIDGTEEVYQPKSNIINQARTICIESENDEDCFVPLADMSRPGITIKSDTTVDIFSELCNDLKSQTIDAIKQDLTTLKTTLSAQVSKMAGELTAKMTKMNLLTADQGLTSWGLPEVGLRTYPEKFWQHQDDITDAEVEVYGELCQYYSTLSRYVEVCRKLKALDNIKKKVDDQKGDYKTKSTGVALNIKSENVNVASKDGDGNIRDIGTAGISVLTPHLDIQSTDKDGALIKDSSMSVNTQHVSIVTNNASYSSDEHDSGDLKAVGDVSIISKNFAVAGLDLKLSSGKIEEDDLASGSNIILRSEKVAVEAADKDGKATGSVKVTGKEVILRSQDIDPKEGTGKDLTSGGTVAILAEKTYVGSNGKKSKLVQVAAEKVGIIGKDTAEMQQNGKAVVTLSGGNMTAGGSKVEVNGDTTIKGGADIKGEVKSPKVTASVAFSSPNINDTMGVGVPGVPGTASAKMTEEEYAES